MKARPTLPTLNAAVVVCIAFVTGSVITASGQGVAPIGDAAAGTAIFDSFASVALKTLKEPGKTVEMGPKRLDFSAVSPNKSALNILEITNGTNSPIEVRSLSVPSSGFRIASSLTLPLMIPPQTQALFKVEFLPTRAGDYGGEVQVLYRTGSSEKPRKMGITLKGKGVPK